MELDEGKRIFLQESTELLEDMEAALLRLESSPGDQEAINSIFRAVHTIKGSAGVVGIDGAQAFTHKVENALDRVRQGDVQITTELINVLLDCRDLISTLIAEETGMQPRMQYTAVEASTLLSRLAELIGIESEPAASVSLDMGAPPEEVEEADDGSPRAQTDNWHISLRFTENVLRNGMDPISFLNYMSRLGEITSIVTMLDAMPPPRAMDPESCYLGFEIDLKADCTKEEIQDVFEFVAEDATIHIIPPGSKLKEYVRIIESLPEDTMKLGEILLRGGALTHKEVSVALLKQRQEPERQLGDIVVSEGLAPQSVVDAAVNKQQQQQTRTQDHSSIRVDTRKLDLLIDTVGELVISGATIKQHADRLKDRDLQASVNVLTRLIDDIRDSSMGARMIPLHDTFNRFKRVIRDMAQESGKDIELEIMGGETELDRTMIEKIKDPLMHLVRNSADHGIELPRDRKAAGKPERAHIFLSAYQETGDVIIEIRDDGRGLDRKKIIKKAVDRGIIPAGAELSREEVVELVFAPGFSTAEAVTNISGRGVGMDVVKRNIESLRGSVSIESEEGAGTTVKIRLPLTLAIIDGFLVQLGSFFYVVPMDMVQECIELTPAAVKAAHGRKQVNLRGTVLPYIVLRDMFHIRDANVTAHEFILIVQHGGHATGLLVDVLHGEIQTVVKPLGHMYRDIRGISGATIMGDGTVALILDVPALVKIALEQSL